MQSGVNVMGVWCGLGKKKKKVIVSVPTKKNNLHTLFTLEDIYYKKFNIQKVLENKKKKSTHLYCYTHVLKW